MLAVSCMSYEQALLAGALPVSCARPPAICSMSSHSLAVSCVRWGGDGLLYSASKDTTINVWDSQVRVERFCESALSGVQQETAGHEHSKEIAISAYAELFWIPSKC